MRKLEMKIGIISGMINKDCNYHEFDKGSAIIESGELRIVLSKNNKLKHYFCILFDKHDGNMYNSVRFYCGKSYDDRVVFTFTFDDRVVYNWNDGS